MLIDGLQLTAIAKELGSHLKGSRVNKIYQPSKDLILLDIFPSPDKSRLALSINRQFGFAGFITAKLANPPSPPTFCALLRNRLKSAIILDIIPAKTDRIICFVLSTKKDDKIEKFFLELRLTGNKPNLLLFSEDGQPAGKLHNYSQHTGPINQDRDFLSPDKSEFIPPVPSSFESPARNDASVLQSSAEAIAQYISETRGSIPLCHEIPGLSPNLADFILNCCETADHRDTMSSWLTKVISGELPIEARVIQNKLSGKKFIFPYGTPPLLPTNTTIGNTTSLMSLVEDFYFIGSMKAQFSNAKRQLLKILTVARKKLTRKACKLKEGLENSKTADYYTHQGELLKSVLYKIERSTKVIMAFDWLSNTEVEMPINPRISPQNNLEKYYSKARKIKRTLPVLKQQIKETKSSLAIINTLLTLAEDATEISAIEQLNAKFAMINTSSKRGNTKLRKKGPGKTKIKQSKEKKNRRKLLDGLRTFVSSDGFKIYVGRNGRENAILSGKFLQKKDLWFHIRDDAGPHVVIKMGQRDECPSVTKKEAAQLAVYFSSKRYERSVQVTYCRGFEVKTVPGGKPGLVSLRNYSCMTVIPDPGIMEKVIAIVLA